MGADNLLQFDRWRNWEEIMRTMPVAVIDRPGASMRATSAKAAQRFPQARLNQQDARLLPDLAPPAYVYLHGPRSAASSTALRRGD
jgi:nicotinate-nucleotide adenylyltransferase